MDRRSDGCVSCYFIGKQFFQFANFLCEFLHRSRRSFLRLGVGLKTPFTELFAFALGGPKAPTAVERQEFGS